MNEWMNQWKIPSRRLAPRRQPCLRKIVSRRLAPYSLLFNSELTFSLYCLDYTWKREIITLPQERASHCIPWTRHPNQWQLLESQNLPIPSSSILIPSYLFFHQFQHGSSEFGIGGSCIDKTGNNRGSIANVRIIRLKKEKGSLVEFFRVVNINETKSKNSVTTNDVGDIGGNCLQQPRDQPSWKAITWKQLGDCGDCPRMPSPSRGRRPFVHIACYLQSWMLAVSFPSCLCCKTSRQYRWLNPMQCGHVGSHEWEEDSIRWCSLRLDR